MKNELLIASAGAGKTTLLVNEAIKSKESVLITTFTEENKEEIIKKIIKISNGGVPSHVTVRTWFSFLIEHGARPYQGGLTEKTIRGLLLVNKKSGLKYKGEYPIYYKESEIEKHYFVESGEIYSDKLSKFVVRCNEKSNGYVIERISSLFKNIFIDEVQDMAGYDLEIIKLLSESNSSIKIAGDPRQVTYHTHFSQKYKKYSEGRIQDFIQKECKKNNFKIDVETLSGSWRSNEQICTVSNLLFPEYPKSGSLQTEVTNHDGIFLVREKDIDKYLNEFSPTQLRHSRNKKVSLDYEVLNFGESKGTTRNRVLIYPTKQMLDWLLADKKISSFETKCKFYVAITRAKFSVALVCKNNIETDKYPIYKP